MNDSRSAQLTVTVLRPPTLLTDGRTLLFGLQNKAGALQTGKPLEDGAVVFTTRVTVRGNTISGACVHSGQGERFLYLSMGAENAPQQWIRRYKVNLDSVNYVLEKQDAASCTIDLQHGISPPRVPFVKEWA
jgi:hypothetical protein